MVDEPVDDLRGTFLREEQFDMLFAHALTRLELVPATIYDSLHVLHAKAAQALRIPLALFAGLSIPVAFVGQGRDRSLLRRHGRRCRQQTSLLILGGRA